MFNDGHLDINLSDIFDTFVLSTLNRPGVSAALSSYVIITCQR